jgi:hypothetical protein
MLLHRRRHGRSTIKAQRRKVIALRGRSAQTNNRCGGDQQGRGLIMMKTTLSESERLEMKLLTSRRHQQNSDFTTVPQ